MSSQYRKIKYDAEGPYGTIEEKWLYVHSHDTADIVHVFDDSGEELFCYSESGFDMGGSTCHYFNQLERRKDGETNS